VTLRQQVEQLKDRYDDMREQIESLGLQVDGAEEAMEMTLEEFMENVASKLEAMNKKISKLYTK
jgi:cell division septum initiation protein DivIVA